jgi:F0F1-type ATP synthase assembly protein I
MLFPGNSRENLRKAGKDAAWVLAMGAQGGLMLALPVVAGLALGFWLDRLLGLGFPWLTLVMTLIGAIVGPVLLYRWVMRTVAERVQERAKAKEADKERPRDGEA